MELFTYSYNIQNYTLNGKIAINKLNNEIINSEITIAFSHTTINNEQIFVSFKAELEQNDEDLLIGIINNHDGIDNTVELPQQVKVIEESSDGIYKTNGKFQAENIVLSIDASHDIYKKTISYGHYIGLLSATWFCNENNIGDVASFYIAPNVVIGYATDNISSGNTVISVSDTVVENVIPGYLLQIDENECITISEVDKINKTITLKEPIDFNITVGNLIRFKINILSNFLFTGIGQISLGQSKIGSALIPPNTEMILEYKNNNEKGKEFSVLIEYMY